MSNNKNRLAAGFLLAFALLAACTSGSPSLPPATLQSITITPTNGTVKISRLPIQLTATGVYSYGPTQDLTATVAWTDDGSGIVSVDASGLVSLGTGTTGTPVTITATGTVVGTTTITLMPNAFTIAGAGDPLATQQWHLKNTGQKAYAENAGTAGFDINVEPVYSNATSPLDICGLNTGCTGYGVKVAVVDTGLEIAHEDLAANVILNGSWNFNNSTTNPTSNATDGDHGTSVAGLIAGHVYNAKGGMGVAPEASLKGFNFLSSSQTTAYFIDSLGGSPSNPDSSDIDIFNQSFGLTYTFPYYVESLFEAQYLSGVSSLRSGLGAVYVKAAGNGFDGFDTYDNLGNPIPAACTPANILGISCENANFDGNNVLPYNLVVGALNAKGVKSSYSTSGSALWVSAPGGESGADWAAIGSGYPYVGLYDPAMITTDQSGCDSGYAQTKDLTYVWSSFDGNLNWSGSASAFNPKCNYTNEMNGTSSATPVTTGVIALMLEANPNLTWRDVKHILASTARQVDTARAAVTIELTTNATGCTVGIGNCYMAEQGWITNAAGFKYHNWYGFGLVDAAAAVSMAKGYAGAWTALTTTGWTSNATGTAIPGTSTVGASTTNTLAATPTFVEAVQVEVSIDHSYWGDLGIELTSPSGTKSILKNIRDGFDFDSTPATESKTMLLLSNAFYGETSVGTWTIKVVDGNNTAPSTNTTGGTLNSWRIRIYGH